MRRVNVHLEEQQLEGLREFKKRTGVPVNTLVRRTVSRLLVDTKKHGLSSLVFNDQSASAEPTQSK
ncbi:MAG: ribbon-helix-helix protein, CopG family [Caldilineaceae bacterium]|nr:ribbon-helix-helix protein, CopG family [Caldilineaceae bacterium]